MLKSRAARVVLIALVVILAVWIGLSYQLIHR